MGGISTYLVLKALRLEEITSGMSADKLIKSKT